MPKVDCYFLAFAYLLLVCIVAGMGWYIGRELDHAEEERCSLAKAELILGATQALALERASSDDFKDDVANSIIRAADEIQGVCNIQIEPVDLFNRVREAADLPEEPVTTEG